MNDSNINVFIKTVENGSFSKAAKECYCSSVSVMNQINAVENEIGVTLFYRTNHGVQLTAAGRAFYEDLLQIRGIMKNAIRNAQQIQASGKKVIRIGTSILRPCKELISIWEKANAGRSDFQIILVPFKDDPVSLQSVLNKHTGIDCFVAPCDPVDWQDKYNICLIRNLPCRIGVPRSHPLSEKKSLTWKDLSGESIIVIRSGLSATLNRLRNDILSNHHDVRIIDANGPYNIDDFNYCVQMNCLMETLDIWTDVHPSLVTMPMEEWNHASPYGIVYSRDPSTALQEFMGIIMDYLQREKSSEGSTDIARL